MTYVGMVDAGYNNAGLKVYRVLAEVNGKQVIAGKAVEMREKQFDAYGVDGTFYGSYKTVEEAGKAIVG